MKKINLLFIAFVFLVLNIVIVFSDDSYKMISPYAVTKTADLLKVENGGWYISGMTPETKNPLLDISPLERLSGTTILRPEGLKQDPKQDEQFFKENVIYTYDTKKRLEYNYDWGQMNIYLYDRLGNEMDLNFSYDAKGFYKFGAIDESLQDGELNQYTFIIKSSNKVYTSSFKNPKNNLTYPIIINSHNSNETFKGSAHKIDFFDICNKPYSDCSIISNGYETMIFFTSDKNIDPLIDPVNTCGDITSSGVYNVASPLVAEGTCIIISADNVLLKGNSQTIDFNTVANDNQYGILVTGSHRNITITGFADIRDTTGGTLDNSAIYADNELNNSAITSNTLNAIGCYGTYGTSGLIIYGALRDSNISSNTMYSTCSTMYGLNLFSTLENTTIQGNYISSDADAINIGNPTVHKNNFILDNTLVSANGKGIAIASLYNSTIYNNDLSGINQEGIYVGETDGINITKNTITSAINYAVYLSALKNSFVDYNTFESNGVKTFYVNDPVRNITLKNNVLTSNNEDAFYMVSDILNSTIKNNIINANFKSFVVGGDFRGCVFMNNTLIASGGVAFENTGTFSENILINNTIFSDSDIGFYMSLGIYNSYFENNNISSGSASALYAIYTENNIFYKNIFKDFYSEALNNDTFNNNTFLSFNIPVSHVNMTLIDQTLKNHSIPLGNEITIKNYYGIIKYDLFNTSGLNLYGNTTADIRINNNSVFVNANHKDLNKTANVTLFYIPYNSKVQILRNGVNCTVAFCNNLTYKDNSDNTTRNYTFIVKSWSNYSINGTWVIPSTPSTPITSYNSIYYVLQSAGSGIAIFLSIILSPFIIFILIMALIGFVIFVMFWIIKSIFERGK